MSKPDYGRCQAGTGTHGGITRCRRKAVYRDWYWIDLWVLICLCEEHGNE